MKQSFSLGPSLANSPGALADDLLEGAGPIARFVYGDERKRRQIYHLAEAGHLPVFRLGTKICARQSTLLAWIAAQERKADGEAA